MGQEKVCRTCLKASSTDDYIELNFTTNPSHTSIREKLKSCVPEMNISDQEKADMCSHCVALLDSAFVFRTTCLNTEKQLKRISSIYYTDLVRIMKEKGENVTENNVLPSTSKKANSSTSAADSTTLSRTWSITTRRSTYRASEPVMPVLEAQGVDAVEEKKKVAQPSKKSKKRLSESQLLQQALKNIPELDAHTPEMLNCSVTVQKLPDSLTSLLMPASNTNKSSKSKMFCKQTIEEAKAVKYCFKCKKWFDRPSKLQHHNQTTHGNQTRHKCFHCKRCFASKHGLHGHISHCWKGLGNFKELLKQQRARPTNASPKKKKAPALKPRDRSPPVLTVKTEPDDEANPSETTAAQDMECPPLLYPMKSEPAEPTTDPLAADNDLLQNSAEEPIFHCNLCGEMFSSEKDLKDHKLTHAKCRVCSESFQSDEAKNEHERLHYSAKAGFLYCLICKVDVKNRDHFNIHAGIRPYNCDYCSKSFTSRSTLHGHRFVHMNDKPHQCAVCQKGFIKRISMLKHRALCLKNRRKEMMVAKNKKAPPPPQNYYCNICMKNFDNNMKMRTHVCMNAQGERIFKCHICEMVLIGRKDFIVHVKRHFVETETQLDNEVVSK